MYIAEDISILTLVHGRRDALRNMLRGIARGPMFPAEVLIVHMNERAEEVYGDYPFAIRGVSLAMGETLNLSRARNMAMEIASTPYAVFLDVDCIPETSLLPLYKLGFQQRCLLISGRVRYLPKGFDKMAEWMDNMYVISTPDPVRSGYGDYPYELFWSLNFGCSKETFEHIGGFDTAFIGYGGEDTDFGFSAWNKEVPHQTIDAFAFHQYHPSYDPPVNHLKSVVANASYFYGKWGAWPMGGWLKKFEDRGLILRKDNSISILREPTSAEIERCLRD